MISDHKQFGSLQFLASSAKNLLIWNLGCILAFPAIVIPPLTGVDNHLHADESLRISSRQASWLASTIFIGQPIGSLISGVLTDRIGRRMTMLLVSIPNIIAWLMLTNTNSITIIHISFACFGVGAGLMEAPIMTYLSEIWYIYSKQIIQKYYMICFQLCPNGYLDFSEPSIRGVLMAFSGISSAAGTFMVFLLGAFYQWRQVAFFCSFVPMAMLFAVCFVMEDNSSLYRQYF